MSDSNDTPTPGDTPYPGEPPGAEPSDALVDAFNEGPEEVPPQDPIEALAHEPEGTAGEPAEGVADEMARLRAERDEYLEHLRRLQADFDNFRKRIMRDQSAHLERATAGLIEQLLPVLDTFELAMLNAGTDAERLRKGIELVYSELLGVLEKAGLERIEAKGKPFDPEIHEAVMSVEDDGEPGVRDVVRTGYRLKGRVLRPAMVKVAT
jgi:molecular chaperone GrpE